MLSSLRKKSDLNRVVNSTTNVHSEIVKKTGHTAEADSQLRRPRSPVEDCGFLGRCGMMISGLDTQTRGLLDGIKYSLCWKFGFAHLPELLYVFLRVLH